MPQGFGRGPHWWHNQFQDAGFRITMPRQAILDLLSKTDKHLSAEDIYIDIHKTYSNIGLTTVYRTLELLVNMGLVLKFDFGDGRARYELTQGPRVTRHHHHLVCTDCGRVIDYKDFVEKERELISQTEKGLSRKYNFKINAHQIRFLGLCEKCQMKH
jgi:Fur family ferric uptake transcriptional regulator